MALIEKNTIIAGNRLHDKDTGSADVQIALLTQRINYLTEHLKVAAKDHSSRRGLITMVSKRRRLLDYLNRTSKSRYETLIKKLKIRK
ncbi:MAG: 30S ribosomal protein S15 [Verrucomicrobiales bacterium]|jgi:small subunit ribosomal protein S15|nr:30S ribosomal protein S15 [Verrucomicrobiales bacterium]